METFMLTFCNATEPDREEEMNNWYTWVHIRDVMSMENSTVAVQRFEVASIQPTGADLRRKYLTLYEVADKALCTKKHLEWTGTLKLEISTAFDIRTFAEAYWDPVYGTAEFASYADCIGDKTVLTARMDGGEKVESLLPPARLKELAGMAGFKAVYLTRYGKDQMPTSAAKTESVSHMLIAQLTDSSVAAQSWNDFAAAKGLAALQTQPVIFKPIINRFNAAERAKTPEWRALTFLSHAILGASDKTKIFEKP
jgi:hypothetical protein